VLCDTVSERARLAGAVNVVRKEADGALAGDLLDGEGFAAGLEQAGVALAGKRAFLAGAGGAASAIAFALAERGVARLTIANRSQDKAEALARRLAPLFPDLALSTEAGPEDHDIAINATSLGLKEGDPLPFDPARLPAGALVAEVVMQPDIARIASILLAYRLRPVGLSPPVDKRSRCNARTRQCPPRPMSPAFSTPAPFRSSMWSPTPEPGNAPSSIRCSTMTRNRPRPRP
jgi:hypothetical protein